MNSNAGVKADLKNVLRRHLDKAASSLFVDKSFAIIDQSADSKESLTAAVDRISKRIALFINEALAQTVYDTLMASIEKTPSPQGTRRRYKRVAFKNKILVKYNGRQHELDSVNLSEGGIFIRTDKPFPASSEIELILPLGPGRSINLPGVVIYGRTPLSEVSRFSPGMGIEFRGIDDASAEMLRNYIRGELARNPLND